MWSKIFYTNGKQALLYIAIIISNSITSIGNAQEYDYKVDKLLKNHTSRQPRITPAVNDVITKANKLANSDIDNAIILLSSLEKEKLNSDEEALLYFLRGKFFALRKDFDRSNKSYKMVLKDKGKYRNLTFSYRIDTHYALAKQYYLIKDYRNSLKYFNHWLIHNKKPSSKIYFMLGEIYFHIGKYDTALSYLKLSKKRRSSDKELRNQINLSLKKVKHKLREINVKSEKSTIENSSSNIEYWPLLKIAPIFPSHALKNNIQGHVLLVFDISRKGYPTNIKIKESSNSIFNKPAINAVKQFKYVLSEKIDQKIFARGIFHKVSFELK